MPRIRDSRSDPYDFCHDCFKTLYPTEAAAEAVLGGRGDGPDGRGNCFAYDDHHPDYAGTGYRCHACRKPLTGRDDLSHHC